MSDMVQKLDQDMPKAGRARCNLSWFVPNLGSRCIPLSSDISGPTKLKIVRPIDKRIEIWHRVSFTKSDSVFELVASFPEKDYAEEDNQLVG